MPDNGFGAKANSADFLIRAYYIRPEFKTAQGGTGSVAVGDYISFRDPGHHFGFTIVNENSPERLLTGADIDPESLQRDHNGELWVGDEFGPWILHFSADGVLLDPPFPIPGVRSPNNPGLRGQPPTQPNSRGFEGMAITPDGKNLYAILEGANIGDPDQNRRYMFEFSVKDKALTGRTWQYRTIRPNYMVGDMSALDEHRLVLIERDGGRGATAVFRELNVVDLRNVAADGFLVPRTVVDLTAIPDPNLIPYRPSTRATSDSETPSASCANRSKPCIASTAARCSSDATTTSPTPGETRAWPMTTSSSLCMSTGSRPIPIKNPDLGGSRPRPPSRVSQSGPRALSHVAERPQS